MFKTTPKISEDVREEKQIRKILPYTVTDIGGKAELRAWKAEQARKQEEWDAGRSDRYEVAKSRAVDIITGVKKPPSANDIADRKYQELDKLMSKSADPSITRIVEEGKSAGEDEKSILAKIGQTVLDKFLNVNFEPKK